MSSEANNPSEGISATVADAEQTANVQETPATPGAIVQVTKADIVPFTYKPGVSVTPSLLRKYYRAEGERVGYKLAGKELTQFVNDQMRQVTAMGQAKYNYLVTQGWTIARIHEGEASTTFRLVPPPEKKPKTLNARIKEVIEEVKKETGSEIDPAILASIAGTIKSEMTKAVKHQQEEEAAKSTQPETAEPAVAS